MASYNAAEGSSRKSRRRGHNWTLKGTKSQRAAARKERSHFRFYAVAKGRNPDIYSSWTECKEQVHGYHRPKFKGFDNLRKAREWMRVNGPAFSTPTPATPATTTQAQAEPAASTVPSQPRRTPADFQTVAELASLIANDPGNTVLDPSLCGCHACPYSRTKNLREQRFLLMRRLHQLNHVIRMQEATA